VIRTVTPNPALDLTYEVPHLVPAGEHRATRVARLPGGKGLNVARVLHLWGWPVDAIGLIGGPAGRELAERWAALGVRGSWVEIEGSTRQTVAVVDDVGATYVGEPGPEVTAADWERLTDQTLEGLAPGDVVVLSGSLPPGSAPEAVGRLVTRARQAGLGTIVDSSGPALLAAARAGATLLKPNAAELAAATGEVDLANGLAALVGLGARGVVVSCGADGLIGRDPVTGELVRAFLPTPLNGNPTGAGDSAVAALGRGLDQGLDNPTRWRDTLLDAVAWSAATVMEPTAGSLDRALATRLRADVRTEPITQEDLSCR
jgi:1-phosphofructokinase family hexose kinase